MKGISGKQLARILEARGWELRRISGSHHIYTHAGNDARISLPVHGNQTLKIGLQKHLMKIAGLSEADL